MIWIISILGIIIAVWGVLSITVSSENIRMGVGYNSYWYSDCGGKHYVPFIHW